MYCAFNSPSKKKSRFFLLLSYLCLLKKANIYSFGVLAKIMIRYLVYLPK